MPKEEGLYSDLGNGLWGQNRGLIATKTIQTQAGVTVAATTGTHTSGWFLCDGYSEIGLTLLNDAATASSMNIDWSHDGATAQGGEAGVIPSATGSSKRAGNVPVKAKYFRIILANTDAASHLMSAWAYLKA